MADAMHEEGFVDAGYTYIQVDDCWAASKRNAAGAIVPDPVRFPSGMKALADYVHAKGMKLGLCEPCATDKTPLDGTGCAGGPKTLQVCGLCGIMSDSSYPTGGHLA